MGELGVLLERVEQSNRGEKYIMHIAINYIPGTTVCEKATEAISIQFKMTGVG